MNAAISPDGLSIEAKYLLTRVFIRSIVNANFRKGALFMKRFGSYAGMMYANMMYVRNVFMCGNLSVREE